MATMLETREPRALQVLMAASAVKSAPAVHRGARAVVFSAPARWCWTHVLLAETWAATEVRQTELQATEVQQTRVGKVLIPTSYITSATADRAAQAAPAV